MSLNPKRANRRNSRPVCEMLETRALLSVAGSIAASSTAVKAYSPSKSPLLTYLPAAPQITATTTAANGDYLPIGVAVAPANFAKGGILKAGQTLVTDAVNYDSATSTTSGATSIFRVNAVGDTTLFAETPAGTNLTAGIGILSKGFVIVGNSPGGISGSNASPGSLLILNSNGQLVGQFSSPLINGPFDLTVNDQGSHAQVFVSNQSGTVVRFNITYPKKGAPIQINSGTEVAAGYTVSQTGVGADLGPAGLAYDSKSDTLYVASAGDNEVYAVQHAGKTKGATSKGAVVFANQAYLDTPQGLAFAPNGDLITSNGDFSLTSTSTIPNELIEFTTKGKFVAQYALDPQSAGQDSGFGLAVTSTKTGATLAAVDELLNQVDFFKIGKN